MTHDEIGHGFSPAPVQSPHSLESELVTAPVGFLLPHFAEPRRRDEQAVVVVCVNDIIRLETRDVGILG